MKRAAVVSSLIAALASCDGDPLRTDDGGPGDGSVAADGAAPERAPGDIADRTGDPILDSLRDGNGGAGEIGTGGAGGGGGGSAGMGGASGGAGGSGGGAGGTGPAGPECTEATQCRLHSDCCRCIVLAPGETAPPCSITNCFADTCSTLDIREASCAAGRCIVGYQCDGARVACDALPPTCQPGEVPSVRGACWGGCVPASECLAVTACSECAAADLCVENVAHRPSLHCVPVPPACRARKTCACLGPAVCVRPFNLCTEGGGPSGAPISCGCPTC